MNLSIEMQMIYLSKLTNSYICCDE